MSKINEPDIYYIPHNFEDAGGILNGMIQPRNAAEGAVLAIGSAVLIWLLVPISTDSLTGLAVRGGLIVFISLTLLILGAIGLGGEPLSRFVLHMIRFRKNKRRMKFSRRRLHVGPNKNKE